jgi:hypothetical protein
MSIYANDLIHSLGKFGDVGILSPSTDITLWTASVEKPYRYLIEPSTNINVILPEFTSTDENDKVRSGHTLIIKNTSTENTLRVLNSSSQFQKDIFPNMTAQMTIENASTWYSIDLDIGTGSVQATDNDIIIYGGNNSFDNTILGLNKFCDFTISNFTDGQVLIYNNGVWKNTDQIARLAANGGLLINGSETGYFDIIETDATISTNYQLLYNNSGSTDKIFLNGNVDIIRITDAPTSVGSVLNFTNSDFTKFYLDVNSTYVSGLQAVRPNEGSRSLALGLNANTNDTTDSIVLGTNATVSDDECIAIGKDSVAGGTQCVAVGVDAQVSGTTSCGMGRSVRSSGTNSIAVGYKTTSTGTDRIAIGRETTVTGLNSMGIGSEINMTGVENIAIGTGIGTVSSDQSTMIGYFPGRGISHTATPGTLCYSIGNETEFTGNKTDAYAIGHRSTAGSGAVAIGAFAGATGTNSTAIGRDSTCTGNSGVAIGSNSTSTGLRSFAVGYLSSSTATNSYAIGKEASASAQDAFAVGYQSSSSGLRSFAIGSGASSSGIDCFALGRNSTCSGDNSFAAGRDSTTTGDRAFAIGRESEASGNGAFALGHYTKATATNSVVIGCLDGVGGTSLECGGENSFLMTYLNKDMLVTDPNRLIICVTDGEILYNDTANFTTSNKLRWNIEDTLITVGNQTDSQFSSKFALNTNDSIAIDLFLEGTSNNGDMWIYEYLANASNTGSVFVTSTVISFIETSVLNSSSPLIFTGETDVFAFGITTTGLSSTETIRWNMSLSGIYCTF